MFDENGKTQQIHHPTLNQIHFFPNIYNYQSWNQYYLCALCFILLSLTFKTIQPCSSSMCPWCWKTWLGSAEGFLHFLQNFRVIERSVTQVMQHIQQMSRTGLPTSPYFFLKTLDLDSSRDNRAANLSPSSDILRNFNHMALKTLLSDFLTKQKTTANTSAIRSVPS